jgi:hypothetical protein
MRRRNGIRLLLLDDYAVRLLAEAPGGIVAIRGWHFRARRIRTRHKTNGIRTATAHIAWSVVDELDQGLIYERKWRMNNGK